MFFAKSEPFMVDSVLHYPIQGNVINVDLKKPQKTSIFDYFKHIELIPLETNENSLISRIAKVIFHQNRYYILNGSRGVYVFDEDGRFILKIVRIGRGPGEYTSLSDMFINPFTGNIDLLTPWGSIHSYDLQGNHVWSSNNVLLNSDITAVHHVLPISETTYVFYSWVNKSPFRIIYYDLNEMKIFHKEYERNLEIGSDNPFYQYIGQWYFYQPDKNMTYEVGANSLIESYAWDFGNLNYDANKINVSLDKYKNNTRLLTEEIYNRLPYRIYCQGQNNRYVMASVRVSSNLRANSDVTDWSNIIYDKSTQESKFIESFSESVTFYPWIVTDEYVLSHGGHARFDELERYITAEILDEPNRKKFEAFMNTSEEPNPVIIKYYFK